MLTIEAIKQRELLLSMCRIADHVGCLALRLHQQLGDIADPANEAVDVGRWPDNFRHFFSDPAKGIRQDFFSESRRSSCHPVASAEST